MSTKDNYKKAFSSGAKGRTNFLVFGILAVAIAGAAAFVSKKGNTGSTAAAQVMKAPDGASGVTDANKASEAYLNTLKDSNKQEIDKAQQTGTSAVATLTSKAVKIDDGIAHAPAPTTVIVAQPEQAIALPPAPQFAPPQGSYMVAGQAVQSSGHQQSGFEQNKALAAQVGELMNTWGAPGQSIQVVRGEASTQVAAQSAAQQAATQQSATQQVAASGGDQAHPVLIPAGKVLSAVLDLQNVSDDGGPVSATIVAGPYKGAKLLGVMTVTRDAGRLNFSSMSFKGATAAISAVAIDPDSGRVGMADDVDKHWFQKYGLVIASSFLGGYGEAASQQGTTVTETGMSTVVQKDPLSPALRTQVALGKAGTAVAQQLAQESGQIKTTVSMNQGKPVGILFMKDVTAQ